MASLADMILEATNRPIRQLTIGDIEKAREFVKRLNEKREPLQPGDLVVWRKGMKNVRFPDYGEIMVVSEVFEPVRPEGTSGSPYEMERYDCKCIVCVDSTDGVDTYDAYAMDSRRLEKFKG